MSEPQYENEEKAGIIVRVLSLAVAGCLVWFYLDRGTLRGGRLTVGPLVALAMIWFPEMASRVCLENVSTRTASLLGWGLMLLLTVLPALSWLVNR